MTDTPTDAPGVAEAESSEGDAAVAVAAPDAPGPATSEATPVPATAADVALTSPEPVPFWQRPLVERFLIPLVVPIAVIVGLVAYVLNISRLFLSGHGHIPIFVGSAILVLILAGAAALSYAAPRMRESLITIVSAAFILAIMSGGWLVLGHSQPEKTGPTTLPATLKTKQTLNVTAAPGGQLKFTPNELSAKTGLASIVVTVAGAGHTFNLQDPTTLFESLSLDAAGAKKEGVAFFPKAGSYTFFCAVPGHEAAGMKGEINVTGDPMTLDQAVTAAGNPPGAAG
ncbi:MAG TPA: plastocyanin/azurin family copper-binding protein [Acidimicrobiia bacterium]|nr:plastocyanin/azurin family copper-binding protein [Acidimicrobiia bacterium]